MEKEKAHPYPHVVYTMSEEALEYGRAKNEQALHTLLEAEHKKDYKPYNVQGTQLVELHDLW